MPQKDENVAFLLLTWFISVTGLAAAIVFGVFSVLSYTNSQKALVQADTASLLALAAVCGNFAAQVIY